MLQIQTLLERPDFEANFFPAALSAQWPKFSQNDPIAELFYGDGYLEQYREFVLVASEIHQPQKMVARACSVPFLWNLPDLPEGGWDAVVMQANDTVTNKRSPNAVSALEITVHPDHQGTGLSKTMLIALRDNARRLGFEHLYAPVRPSHKHLEPLTPMAEYSARVREDGLPSDPWLRTHVRIGGRILSVAPHSMTISATLERWREWTGLPFKVSGAVIVAGALAPVLVSLEHNIAVYVEPNVWVHHSLD
jgi:GNAT superfamily N-acetyltransferase